MEKIEKLYAYIIYDKAGREEKILCSEDPEGGIIKLITPDLELMNKGVEAVKYIAKDERTIIKFVEFSAPKELAVYDFREEIK